MWMLALRFLPFLGKISPKHFKLIGIGIGVLAMALLWWRIEWLKGKVETLEAQATILTYERDAAQDANDSNQRTITSLKAANESLAQAVVVNTDVRDAAAEKARQRAIQAARDNAALSSELEDLRNANPSCEELASIDMGAVCPLVVERMRQHAAKASGQN